VSERAATQFMRMAERAFARCTALEDALAPFAAISLARDSDPSAPDMIDAPDMAITPNDVRRARAALARTAAQGKGDGDAA